MSERGPSGAGAPEAGAAPPDSTASTGPVETDVLILGGGVSGMACAVALGDHAIVLEREKSPGGLVRGISLDGFWFDHVLHLLYFPDEATEQRVRALPGLQLAPCPPVAWVESKSGRARFPIQNNLRDLPTDVIVSCIADLAEAAARAGHHDPGNYRELLLDAFGPALCEEFFFPYNEKMWRRPLTQLATRGFHWNISRPNFRQVLEGALPANERTAAYNSRGWYPRPASGGRRGMEGLSHALAGQVRSLRLEHEVTGIHLGERRVRARQGNRVVEFRWRERLVNTLPLPVALGLVEDLPAPLRESSSHLHVNRVLSACFCIRGPRPRDTGHWRYYADLGLSFTRLIFMHEFDPETAPSDGWGLMAEIPEHREAPVRPPAEVLAGVRRDLAKVGYPAAGSEIVGEKLLVNDHGYVVFEIGVEERAGEALAFLREHGVEPLGRYGRWEYSSMGQVMRDGFEVGDRLLGAIGAARNRHAGRAG
jgi:protoporphyrinogen oxidase